MSFPSGFISIPTVSVPPPPSEPAPAPTSVETVSPTPAIAAPTATPPPVQQVFPTAVSPTSGTFRSFGVQSLAGAQRTDFPAASLLRAQGVFQARPPSVRLPFLEFFRRRGLRVRVIR